MKLNLTNEEAIEQLDGISKLIGYDKDSLLVGQMQTAIQMAIKSLETQQRWIPCSEKLPEESEDVLVWFEYFRFGDYNRPFRTYGISYIFDNHWSGFVNGESGWRNLKIIAWMPLPAPYQPPKMMCEED